jgi:hypothetical protein
MISAVSSTTPTQPVAQSTAATTQSAGQSKSQPSQGGGDTVQLSKEAQEKSGCSGH